MIDFQGNNYCSIDSSSSNWSTQKREMWRKTTGQLLVFSVISITHHNKSVRYQVWNIQPSPHASLSASASPLSLQTAPASHPSLQTSSALPLCLQTGVFCISKHSCETLLSPVSYVYALAPSPQCYNGDWPATLDLDSQELVISWALMNWVSSGPAQSIDADEPSEEVQLWLHWLSLFWKK